MVSNTLTNNWINNSNDITTNTNMNIKENDSKNTTKKIYKLKKEAKGIFGKKWDKRNFVISNKKLIWKKDEDMRGELNLDSVVNVNINNGNNKSITLKCKPSGCEIKRKNERINRSRKELKLKTNISNINNFIDNIDNKLENVKFIKLLNLLKDLNIEINLPNYGVNNSFNIEIYNNFVNSLTLYIKEILNNFEKNNNNKNTNTIKILVEKLKEILNLLPIKCINILTKELINSNINLNKLNKLNKISILVNKYFWILGKVPIVVNSEKPLLSEKYRQQLLYNFPLIYRNDDWFSIFDTSKDGTSLNYLYVHLRDIYSKRNIKTNIPLLVVIEDNNGKIFGGFSNEKIEINDRYYGDYQSFVFSNNNSNILNIYKWSQKEDKNRFFINSTKEKLAFGGGGDGWAFSIDGLMANGSTHNCQTFDSPPLTNSENYSIKRVQVFCNLNEELKKISKTKNDRSNKIKMKKIIDKNLNGSLNLDTINQALMMRKN
jgi:hypothetical protein